MKKRFLILACTFMVKMIYASSFNADIIIDTTTVVNNTETYKVYDDETNVYLTMKTIDPKVATSILRKGLVIYFDVKGKKKKNVSVTYPIVKTQRPPRRNEDRPSKPTDPEVNDSIIEKIYHMLENNKPQKALYTYYDKIKEFNTILNNEGIAIDVRADKQNSCFLYSLKIPKNKINTSTDINFNKLIIGIKTANIARNTSERTRPTQSARSGGRGGGRGGGRSNGTTGQGISGNPPVRDQSRSKNREIISDVTPIDFWFKVTSN